MSDTDFDTLFDDKARAAHAAGPVGYDEEGNMSAYIYVERERLYTKQ